MNQRLEVIGFCGCHHGFIKGRGMGIAMIMAKLAHLAYIEQETLSSTFGYLKKAYDAMDRERCLEILKGYGDYVGFCVD